MTERGFGVLVGGGQHVIAASGACDPTIGFRQPAILYAGGVIPHTRYECTAGIEQLGVIVGTREGKPLVFSICATECDVVEGCWGCETTPRRWRMAFSATHPASEMIWATTQPNWPSDLGDDFYCEGDFHAIEITATGGSTSGNLIVRYAEPYSGYPGEGCCRYDPANYLVSATATVIDRFPACPFYNLSATQVTYHLQLRWTAALYSCRWQVSIITEEGFVDYTTHLVIRGEWHLTGTEGSYDPEVNGSCNCADSEPPYPSWIQQPYVALYELEGTWDCNGENVFNKVYSGGLFTGWGTDLVVPDTITLVPA